MSMRLKQKMHRNTATPCECTDFFRFMHNIIAIRIIDVESDVVKSHLWTWFISRVYEAISNMDYIWNKDSCWLTFRGAHISRLTTFDSAATSASTCLFLTRQPGSTLWCVYTCLSTPFFWWLNTIETTKWQKYIHCPNDSNNTWQQRHI